MKLAMIGLGRMGGSMTEHLLRAGHAVVASAPDAAAVAEAEKRGAIGAHSVEEVVRKLEPPRVVWLMIPVGPPVEETINALRPLLARGDIIVDGGNSGFTDSVRRAGELAAAGIGFLDAGTSGGVWGLKDGYCLMIGGEAEHVLKVEPIFKALAPPDGYAHVGRAGAGHYAKMIHNAIERCFRRTARRSRCSRPATSISTCPGSRRCGPTARSAVLAPRPPGRRRRSPVPTTTSLTSTVASITRNRPGRANTSSWTSLSLPIGIARM